MTFSIRLVLALDRKVFRAFRTFRSHQLEPGLVQAALAELVGLVGLGLVLAQAQEHQLEVLELAERVLGQAQAELAQAEPARALELALARAVREPALAALEPVRVAAVVVAVKIF